MYVPKPMELVFPKLSFFCVDFKEFAWGFYEKMVTIRYPALFVVCWDYPYFALEKPTMLNWNAPKQIISSLK
jgi:hypothetical protein